MTFCGQIKTKNVFFFPSKKKKNSMIGGLCKFPTFEGGKKLNGFPIFV